MVQYFVDPDCWKKWGTSSDWRDYIVSDLELDEMVREQGHCEDREAAAKCKERLKKDLIQIGEDFDAIKEGYVEEEEE